MTTASPITTTEKTSTTIGRYRWVVCTLLFFATTINYIDRQILALVKPMLDTELGWTNEQFGDVMAAFQAAYGVGLLGFGALVDRLGTRLGYAISIAAWSLAAIAHSAASTVRGFMLARVALGLGEGGNFPSAIKAVALWFPRRERAFATAMFNSGANVGAILAPALVPFIALNYGWQAAFVAAGVAGIAWLALWLPFYDVPEKMARLTRGEREHIESDNEHEGTTQKAAWLQVLKYRQAWSFVVAKALTDPIWWFFLIWLPDYFKSTRGLDMKHSWVHLVTIYSIVTVLSIGGGWLTGFLASRGWSVTRARKTGMFVYACCALAALLVTNAGDWLAVILIGICGAAHQAWSANLYTSASDMFPKRAVASLVGIGGTAGCITGVMFPIYTGKLLDSFKAAGNMSAGYAILFTVCGIAYLLAFALNHALAPRFEPVTMRD
jgi:ACS family hexuronate transporter-like MFS transporter